jgi:putative addiction module component (TIGR02574 family)
MGANARDLGLDKLPVADKVSLINELWADVVAEERSTPMSPELAEKLDKRIAEYEANPDQLHSIEEVMATLKADRQK